MSDKPKKGENQEVHVSPITLRTAVPSVTAWASNNYAEDWFVDALQEARSSGDSKQETRFRRREIVFAAFFLECYIYEWVRGLEGGGRAC